MRWVIICRKGLVFDQVVVSHKRCIHNGGTNTGMFPVGLFLTRLCGRAQPRCRRDWIKRGSQGSRWDGPCGWWTCECPRDPIINHIKHLTWIFHPVTSIRARVEHSRQVPSCIGATDTCRASINVPGQRCFGVIRIHPLTFIITLTKPAWNRA